MRKVPFRRTFQEAQTFATGVCLRCTSKREFSLVSCSAQRVFLTREALRCQRCVMSVALGVIFFVWHRECLKMHEAALEGHRRATGAFSQNVSRSTEFATGGCLRSTSKRGVFSRDLFGTARVEDMFVSTTTVACTLASLPRSTLSKESQHATGAMDICINLVFLHWSAKFADNLLPSSSTLTSNKSAHNIPATSTATPHFFVATFMLQCIEIPCLEFDKLAPPRK